jgi:transcriptional regulator with XRE-family HTH domain
MNEIAYRNTQAESDISLLKTLGAFIRYHRVRQNKSQSQLAGEAGIVRSTLSLFERGENTSILVFIQLLRALKLLHMLQAFEIREELSPLQLAKIEQSRRIRARAKGAANDHPEPRSDW